VSTPEQQCEALALKLRADRELAEALMRAGIAHCHPNALDNVLGMLASYPLKQRMPKPDEVKARNADMLKAIEKFRQACEKFERGGNVLPQLSDALEHLSETQRLRFGPCPPARHLPAASLADYLDMLACQIEGGAYWHPDHMDPLVSTPAGQMPRTPAALAAWLAIRALKAVGLPPGSAFCEAAAAAAEALCGGDVSPDAIKSMLATDGPYDPAAGIW
jgi:hypothetical protein